MHALCTSSMFKTVAMFSYDPIFTMKTSTPSFSPLFVIMLIMPLEQILLHASHDKNGHIGARSKLSHTTSIDVPFRAHRYFRLRYRLKRASLIISQPCGRSSEFKSCLNQRMLRARRMKGMSNLNSRRGGWGISVERGSDGILVAHVVSPQLQILAEEQSHRIASPVDEFHQYLARRHLLPRLDRGYTFLVQPTGHTCG